EHDLAYDASLLEQLLRASCLGKGKSLRDQRLDLFLLKEAEQGDQILPKQSRPQPFERLDAVGDDPFPSGEMPTAGDVQRVDGDSMKAITTACNGRTQSFPTYRGCIGITHHPPARTAHLTPTPAPIP